MLGNSCPAVWKLAFCLGEVTFGWGVSSLVAVRNIMFIVKEYEYSLFGSKEGFPHGRRGEATLLCCAACVTAAWRCDGRAAGAAYGIQKGMSSGDVQSVLIDLPKFIEEALMEGESVTIKGLGSFHVAVTSDGFEHPDDVMPGKVRLSRVYFRPDKSLVARLNSGMDFYRYPLSRYFPHDMLRPETLRKERAEGKTGIPDEDPVGMENDTEDFSGEE